MKKLPATCVGMLVSVGEESGLDYPQCADDDGTLLGHMQPCIAYRGRRRRRTSGIFKRYAGRQRAFQVLAKKRPCAVILRFFLRPDYSLQSRKAT